MQGTSGLSYQYVHKQIVGSTQEETKDAHIPEIFAKKITCPPNC
jgi:hypothetical protein